MSEIDALGDLKCGIHWHHQTDWRNQEPYSYAALCGQLAIVEELQKISQQMAKIEEAIKAKEQT